MSNNMDRKIPFLVIIEWVEQNPNILMWKVPDQDKEIKNGAKLIVRESQNAMLLSEGKIADIFGAGNHTLEQKIFQFFQVWNDGNIDLRVHLKRMFTFFLQNNL